MLNLHQIAEQCRLRAQDSINPKAEEKARKDGAGSRVFAAANKLFHERIMEACTRVSDSPTGIPDEVFIALPERLFGKIGYLACGKGRGKKGDLRDEDQALEPSTRHLLSSYDKHALDSKINHLEAPATYNHIKQLLLCHGLSPIGDSLLLLADLGRVFRMSSLTGFSIQAMLADVSWMSSNRSIRQMESLDDKSIDTGLRVCLDKRRRLYESLGINVDIKEITAFDRATGISGKKLEAIGEHYTALVKSIWGDDCLGRMEPAQVKSICMPLEQLPFRNNGPLPNHMSAIGQFPKALAALENELKPHLEILRMIAKQFNTFDNEVFSYFFAQYYAQDKYRGNSLKIAPISESRFDEPYDELDQYFKAWGDGHSTTELASGAIEEPSTKPMTAIYMPQYTLGSYSLLPYTPLSLDSVKTAKLNHVEFSNEVCLLDIDAFEFDVLKGLIDLTPTVDRNRLLADLLSFVIECIKLWGFKEIDGIGIRNETGSLTSIFDSINPVLTVSVERELELKTAEQVKEMWSVWLKAIQTIPNPEYIPPHIIFYLFTDDDWTEERLNGAANLAKLARECYVSATSA